MKTKRLMSLLLCLLLVSTLFLAGCSTETGGDASGSPSSPVSGAPPVNTQPPSPASADSLSNEIAHAKYVFLFIGDGMGFSQINTAEILLNTINNPGTVGMGKLAFTQFPYSGSVTTYDAESFCPDSASTGTAMASGNKTLGGVINMDVTKSEKFTIISELVKAAGYKIGVITSVSLDHATPACFYAKQASRGDYYDIALQLATSDYDFFGGGGFLQPSGKDKDKESIFDVARANGFTVTENAGEILALDSSAGKVLAVSPILADAQSMPYELDRLNSGDGSLSLAQFVQKGIDVLDNENGFFMMVEGGKIDWACHANDAAASMYDVIAMDDGVKAALDFAAKHPDETLILVTADHETGGLSIGFAATGYSTFFEKTLEQNMSFVQFDTFITEMRENQTTFEDAYPVISAHFGLIAPGAPEASDESKAGLVMTEAEYQKLKDAYAVSMIPASERQLNDEQQLLYGTYEPLSVTCTHILNNKAGIGWTSYAHTGIPVPIFAYGVGSADFGGSIDNTDIFRKLVSVMGL